MMMSVTRHLFVGWDKHSVACVFTFFFCNGLYTGANLLYILRPRSHGPHDRASSNTLHVHHFDLSFGHDSTNTSLAFDLCRRRGSLHMAIATCQCVALAPPSEITLHLGLSLDSFRRINS